MNTSQNNLLATGQSVSTVLETLTATDLPPAFADAQVSLNNTIGDIQTLSITQALPITGTTLARDEIVEIAGKATLVVAGLVAGYAKANGLTELAAAVDLTPTKLGRGRLATRVRLMQQVHDAAAGVVAQLGTYGVTEARVADLQTKITAAGDRLGTPRGAIMARRVATEKLAEAFERLQRLLNDQLDPLMEDRRETDPDAYRLYRAARLVIDRSGPQNQPQTPEPNPNPATNPTTTTPTLAA